MTPPPPAPDDHDADDARRQLSALADGETDAAAAARACAAWADPETQRRWHTYQLIGDVLRSEDLASAPARDHDFLQRLRGRLAAEPAIVVPLPTPAMRPPRPRWALPAAMAAGVMAMAVSLGVAIGPSGGGSPAAPAPTQAQAPAAAAVVATAAAPTPDASVRQRMVRDAQLDRYLRAHREYGTALPGSLPGGAGRSIANVSLER